MCVTPHYAVPENIIYLRLGGFETSFRLLKIDLSDGQLASSLYTRRLLYTSRQSNMFHRL